MRPHACLGPLLLHPYVCPFACARKVKHLIRLSIRLSTRYCVAVIRPSACHLSPVKAEARWARNRLAPDAGTPGAEGRVGTRRAIAAGDGQSTKQLPRRSCEEKGKHAHPVGVGTRQCPVLATKQGNLR
jgi:hypothetical protein